MLHGRNLILAIGGTGIAASKSCSIDTGQSFIDIASPTTGRWTACIPERMNWKVSSDGLLATPDNYTELLNAQTARTALTIRYFDETYGVNQKGTAYIESLSIQGTVGNLVRVSISLRGSGELTENRVKLTPEELDSFQGYLYSVVGGNAVCDTAQQGDDYITFVYKLVLANDIVALIDPSNGLIIESMSQNMAMDASNQRDFGLSDYNAHAYDEETRVVLSAGTHYFIYSSSDPQSFDPAIYQLS